MSELKVVVGLQERKVICISRDSYTIRSSKNDK